MANRNKLTGFRQVNRRHLLKGLGAALALPQFETFGELSQDNVGSTRNFVAVGTYLGWHKPAFVPAADGALRDLPPTLKPLDAFKRKMSVFSGLDHRAPNGHKAQSNFMCGQYPGSYSLDQMIAEEIGQQSRFGSLQLVAGSGETSPGKALSFSKQGTSLPMIARPTVLYRKLFPTADDRARAEYLLTTGSSVLDDVLEDSKSLQKILSGDDRDKLDEYLTAVRAVEKDMGKHLKTVHEVIEPPTGATAPETDPISPSLQIEAENILFDLMVLALQSRSTRVISLFLDGLGQVFSLDGRKLGSGYHGLSHHGNDPNMIRDLVAIESAHMHCLAGFLNKLESKQGANGKSLLDDTVVLVGTGMGDASRHSNRDLSTLVAGGGLKHGFHHKFDPKGETLLGDLYVSLQQHLGMEATRFSNASRNLNHIIL